MLQHEQKRKTVRESKEYPGGLSFEDFCTLMKYQGWILDHQRGSYQIWYSSKSYRLSVQDRNGKAKGCQARQFLMRVEEEGNDDA